jgi:hypothetical protein
VSLEQEWAVIKSVVNGLWPFTNNPRGVPSYNCIGGNIAGDQTASPDNGPFSNGDTGQHNGSIADPNVIADENRTAAISEISRAGIVSKGEDGSIRTDTYIIAHSNGEPTAIKMTALIDHAALAQPYTGTMQKTTM